MTDGTERPQTGDVVDLVRAHRIELVDEAGGIRAVVGQLATPDPARPVYGIALTEPSGRPRVWLSVHDTGPALVFDLAGNNVISLGVNDPAPDAMQVGGYLHFADGDGTAVLGWQVENDGAVYARYGGPTR